MGKIASLAVLLGIVVTLSAQTFDWNVRKIVSLEYPDVAAQARLEGSVDLECSFTADGYVKSTRVIQGKHILAKAAQDNLRKWRFQRVPVVAPGDAWDTMVLHYDFRLSSKSCVRSVCPTTFRFEYPNTVTVEIDAPHWQPEGR
ncbi:MAG: energy transducer TonB [Bryobacteraceae bacterium]|nr:energy transducer TonB [Bryobacteraceae bacterium]